LDIVAKTPIRISLDHPSQTTDHPAALASSTNFSLVLERANTGDPDAISRLWTLAHDELRTLARRALGRGAIDLTLQPTMLVHEIFLRLHGGKAPSVFHNRAHFFGAAAKALERILIDHGRARGRLKRGGGTRPVPIPLLEDLLTIDHDAAGIADLRADLEAVSPALVELERRAPRAAEVVRLKILAGLENADIAGILDISPRTVGNDWLYGKAFLRKALRAASKA
jgi:RNA polymerase sigma factor (TIGR02999 family)